MIDLDTLKRSWHEMPASPVVQLMTREELTALIQTRTLEIRARAIDRIRGESYTYVAVVFAITAINLTSYGPSFKAFASSLTVSGVLGLVVAALVHKQAQLRNLPLSSNLKSSLSSLIAMLDSTGGLYLAAYMACVSIGVLLVEGLLLWRHGPTPLVLLSLVAAAAFMAWCYRSGRSYVERMFGRYRAELTDCLRELEAN